MCVVLYIGDLLKTAIHELLMQCNNIYRHSMFIINLKFWVLLISVCGNLKHVVAAERLLTLKPTPD